MLAPRHHKSEGMWVGVSREPPPRLLWVASSSFRTKGGCYDVSVFVAFSLGTLEVSGVAWPLRKFLCWPCLFVGWCLVCGCYSFHPTYDCSNEEHRQKTASHVTEETHSCVGQQSGIGVGRWELLGRKQKAEDGCGEERPRANPFPEEGTVSSELKVVEDDPCEA